jgi:hypothetical protein
MQMDCVLGDEIIDKEVVKKMLHPVLKKLEHDAISMETLIDLNSISIKEATGHPCAVEQRKKTATPPTADADRRLLLTKETWLAWMKAKEKFSSSGSSNSDGGGGCDRSRGRGRGHDGGRNEGIGNSGSSDGRDDGAGRGACHNCGKMGHWARECRSKAKKAEANAAQDDEPALVLVEAVVVETEAIAPPPPAILPPPPPTSQASPGLPYQEESTPARTTSGPPQAAVHLVKAKVFTLFSEAVEKDPKRWVLDIGATNHMTGSRSAFSKLDKSIHGTIKFGDGSVV